MNIHAKAAQNVSFFQTCDKHFISKIVPFMQFRSLKSKNIIYEKNDYADEIYFLSTGRVAFTYGRTNFTFKTMLAGSFFGEIELIDNTAREFTAITEIDS